MRLAVIPSGYLSDRIGRRTLLIVGLAVSGVATAGLGAVSSLPVFLVGRVSPVRPRASSCHRMQAAVADIIGRRRAREPRWRRCR